MKQLSKNSSKAELREYFAFVISESREPNTFPVDLDILWPIAYKEKSSAVRELYSKNFGPEGEYFILKKNAGRGCPMGGRTLDKYYLSLKGFEFFILRKAYWVWGLYKDYLTQVGGMFLYGNPFDKDLASKVRYILDKNSSELEIAQYIEDMRIEEKKGNKFPILLLEVFRMGYEHIYEAIKVLTSETDLGCFIRNTNYILDEKEPRLSCYISFECFGWLIGKRNSKLDDAFRLAIDKGWYPQKPLYLKSKEKVERVFSKV